MIRNWRSLALISQRPSQVNVFKTLYSSTVPNCATNVEDTKGVKLKDVLQKYEGRNKITASWAVTILNEVVKANPINVTSDFQEGLKLWEEGKTTDPVLHKLINGLSGNIPDDLGIKPLVSIIKSLQHLGAPLDSFQVQNVQNKLTWKCRSCSMRDLNIVLTFSAKKRFDSDVSRILFEEVVKTIELRWVEIDDPQLVSSFLYQAEYFKPQFLARLEDKMIQEAEQMSATNIVSLLKALVYGKQRPVPLIKALCYHFTRKKDINDLKVITDGLYSISQLSVKDQELMETLCGKSMELIKETTEDDLTAVIRSMLTSLGHIAFLHRPLMDSITDWYLSKLDQGISDRDLFNYVLTTANLNYQSPNSDKIYDTAIKQIQLDTLDTVKRPQFVWSLAVLDKVTETQLSSVLNSEFSSKILQNQDVRNMASIQKLLCINAVAKYLCEKYEGPTIELKNFTLDQKSAVQSSQAKNILNAFHNLASPPNFLWENVETLMGFKITSEAVFDLQKLQPIGPIKEMALLGRESSNQENLPSSKKLPENSVRLAVQILGYHDCLLGDLVHLNGAVSLHSRLLKARGYKVMLIRYDDINDKHTELQKVKILEAKLRSALK